MTHQIGFGSQLVSRSLFQIPNPWGIFSRYDLTNANVDVYPVISYKITPGASFLTMLHKYMRDGGAVAVKRILINATYPEATRIAFTQGNNLTAFEVEHASEESTLRNIYKGKISAVNNSLECAFVDIGLERQGMLPFKRLNFRTDDNQPQEEIDLLKVGGQLREGQQILVQVEKEPRGSKGASLTAQISIAGRNIVLKPGRPMRSITRAVKENVRNQLQNTANQLKIPDNFGVIMRTSAHRTKANEIQHEVDHLLELCKEINNVQNNVNVVAPALIYKENNLVHRLFRDKFHRDITEVLVDDDEFYREAKQHAKEFYPQFASKVKTFPRFWFVIRTVPR